MMLIRMVLACGILFTFGAIADGDPIEPDRIRVVDGDTIRLDGIKPVVRLVGFNAPETDRARCAEERALGDLADRCLRALVRGGDLDFNFVRCSCPPGTEGTSFCNRGRECGILKAKGRDVGDVLIAEKLAVPFICGKYRCPRTPRPWC